MNKKYDSPLKEVVSSILLGAPDFIAYIKENFISGKKLDKDLPALKELIEKPSIVDIFDTVESVIGKDAALARNVKIFLCQRYTGEKLKDIGIYFGIGESGVSQASRRIQEKIKKDKRIKAKIDKMIRKLNLSRMKT
jgi:hypothetical protein